MRKKSPDSVGGNLSIQPRGSESTLCISTVVCRVLHTFIHMGRGYQRTRLLHNVIINPFIFDMRLILVIVIWSPPWCYRDPVFHQGTFFFLRGACKCPAVIRDRSYHPLARRHRRWRKCGPCYAPAPTVLGSLLQHRQWHKDDLGSGQACLLAPNLFCLSQKSLNVLLECISFNSLSRKWKTWLIPGFDIWTLARDRPSVRQLQPDHCHLQGVNTQDRSTTMVLC
jgi:hypothetical protein